MAGLLYVGGSLSSTSSGSFLESRISSIGDELELFEEGEFSILFGGLRTLRTLLRAPSDTVVGNVFAILREAGAESSSVDWKMIALSKQSVEQYDTESSTSYSLFDLLSTRYRCFASGGGWV